MQYVKIDSSNRLNRATTGSGQFVIPSMSQSLEKGVYRLKQAYIPNSNYNVNVTNNRIPFTESGVDKVAVLSPGFYTQFDLLDAIGTSMTAASGSATFSVSESLLPRRITIISSVAFQLNFGTSSSNSAAEIIGFANTDRPSSTVHTAENVSNLAELSSYNIVIRGTRSSFRNTSGNSFTFCIPITDNSLGITIYEPTAHFPQTVEFSSLIQTLDISVVDENSNVIELAADWFMIWEHCGQHY